MGFTDKIMGFISPEDDDEVEVEDGYEEEDNEEVKMENTVKKEVVKKPTGPKIVLFEPETYDEAQTAAKCIKNREAIIVNLNLLPQKTAQRMIDFLTGVVFALDGNIKRVGKNVILCSPKVTIVEGDIRKAISEEA